MPAFDNPQLDADRILTEAHALFDKGAIPAAEVGKVYIFNDSEPSHVKAVAANVWLVLRALMQGRLSINAQALVASQTLDHAMIEYLRKNGWVVIPKERVGELRISHIISNADQVQCGAEEYEKIVKDRMVRQLASAMLDTGLGAWWRYDGHAEGPCIELAFMGIHPRPAAPGLVHERKGLKDALDSTAKALPSLLQPATAAPFNVEPKPGGPFKPAGGA